MNDNPYASPVATVPNPYAPQLDPKQIVPASQGKRLANMFIDNIILQVLAGAAGFVVGVAVAASRESQGGLTTDDEAALQAVGMLVGLVVGLAYYAGTEIVFQRTLAKFITGTIVVRADGSRPSAGQIIGRTLCRFIPFEAFSFLASPVGWHDSISGTRVIDVR